MLAIVFYIAGVLLAVLLVAVCLRLYGARPGIGHALASFAPATALLFLFLGLTTVLHPEGHSFLLVLLFWAGSWLLLCFVRPLQRAALLCLPLFVLLAAVSFHHLHLATSQRYTDNPPARLRMIRIADRLQNRRREIVFRRSWHTWLTGLYEVH